MSLGESFGRLRLQRGSNDLKSLIYKADSVLRWPFQRGSDVEHVEHYKLLFDTCLVHTHLAAQLTSRYPIDTNTVLSLSLAINYKLLI